MAAITLPADIASVAHGIGFIADCAVAEGVPPEGVARIELAAEEALVNICHYAYLEAVGTVEIRCMQDEARHFSIELIDSGIPFDMLARPAPDFTVDAAQRPLGGLGIPLIRALMDNATYHREGAQNILRLTALLPL